MRMSTDPEKREWLLQNLRHVVAFHVGMVEASSRIAESINCDISRVMEYVASQAIVADDGMDTTYADLDDLLGIGDPVGSLSAEC